MNFADVGIAIRRGLIDGLRPAGYNVPVVEIRQPTKQGRVEDGVYWQIINPKNYGWQGRRYTIGQRDAGHEERQVYEATMQLTALVRDDDEFGSADLAAVCQMVVNGLKFAEFMLSKGVGLQRASPIRTIDFIDEFDNYSQESSFDFNFTFTKTLAPMTGVVDTLAYGLTGI